MTTSSTDRDPIDLLAEEYRQRRRRGEHPTVEEFVALHPHLADEIRAVLPAFALMDHLGTDLSRVTKAVSSGTAGPPNHLGDYRIIREIGRGGMGVVYQAHQVSLGREVALKVLIGPIEPNRKALERFRREAKAAARLHHTNIVPVFEVGEDGDVAYYAMQYIQGQSLDRVIATLTRMPGTIVTTADRHPRRGAVTAPSLPDAPEATRGPEDDPARQIDQITRSLLVAGQAITERDSPTLAETRTLAGAPNAPPGSVDAQPDEAILPGGSRVTAIDRKGAYFRSVAQIGRQAAQGLAHAHARGVIHRDIKPSNLLLDTAGVVWIADFGLAKAEEDDLTATGDIVGTLRYMAPERFRGEGDGRADVYSLGITLHELLTLRPAYTSADRIDLIETIKNVSLPSLRTLDPRIPRDLETIVLKATEKEPSRRYDTAGAMADDLGRFLADEPIRARRVTTWDWTVRWARRHPGTASLGATLALVLIVATITSLLAASRFRQQADRQATIAREGEIQRGRAESARDQRETMLVGMHSANGQAAAEWGDAGLATLWFAEAARLATRSPERAAVNRTRARTWSRQAPRPVLALEHPSKQVTFTSFQPVGRHLMTLTHDHKLHFWRLEDGTEAPGLPGDPDLTAAVWSPDGSRVAVGLVAGGVAVYRFGDFGQLAAAPFEDPIRCITFSRDGRWLAAGGKTVRVFEAERGRPLGPPLAQPEEVLSVEFDAGGRKLLAGCKNGSFQVSNVAPRRMIPQFAKTPQNIPTGSFRGFSPRFSTTGDAILTLGAPWELQWIDSSNGRASDRGQIALAVDPGGSVLSPNGLWGAVGGSYGPQLFPADPSNLLAKSRLLGHNREVTGCDFSPDSTLLASGSQDRTVQVWSVSRNAPACGPLTHQRSVVGVKFAPDSRHLATCQEDGLVKVWRLPDLPPTLPLIIDQRSRIALRTSANGVRAITARTDSLELPNIRADQVPRVFEIGTGEAVGVRHQGAVGFRDAVLDSTGTWSFAVCFDGDRGWLHCWNVMTGRPRFDPRPLPGVPTSLDIRGDDARIAAVNRRGHVQIFDAEDGRLIGSSNPASLPSPDLSRVRFGRSGTLVVLHPEQLSILDESTHRPRFTPIVAARFRTRFAGFEISPDGRQVALASNSAASSWVRVWDLTTGEPSSPELPHPSIPVTLKWTSDGRRFLTGSHDGQLRVWDWAAGVPVVSTSSVGDSILAIAVLPGDRFAVTGVRQVPLPPTPASSGIENVPGRGDAEGVQLEFWDLASGHRVAPGRKLSASVHGLALTPDGRRGLAVTDLDRFARLDLSDLTEPDTRPIDDWIRLGEIISGQRISDGNPASLTADEWMSRWRAASRPEASEMSGVSPVPVELETDLPAGPSVTHRVEAPAGSQPRNDAKPVGFAARCRAAVVAVLANDRARSDALCRAMLADFGRSPQPFQVESVCLLCLVADVDRAEARRRAELLVRQAAAGQILHLKTRNDAQIRNRLPALLSLAAYRDGNWDEALRYADAIPNNYAEIVRAMVLQHRGRTAEARALLVQRRNTFIGRAAEQIDRSSVGAEVVLPTQLDTMTALLTRLLKEAEAVIELDPAFPADPFSR